MSIQELSPVRRILLGNTLVKEQPYRPPRRLFEYIDDRGELWVINKSNDEPSFSQDPPIGDYTLKVLLTELSSRQHPISTNPAQERHSKIQQFLLNHWSDIRDAIRPSDKNNKRKPYAFPEVDFGDYGRADFIGIASDGSPVIIEVGRSQKPTQVGRHALGLSRVTDASIPIFPCSKV